jgi:hypothetical protein
MKNKHLLLLLCILLSFSSFAQKEKMSREEKDEKNAARTARVNGKNDYATFRKKMLALKEYEAEKQKIPALRKSSKMNVKVVAVIDSTDNDMESPGKTLIGYIRQDVGENTTNMYEVTYDRAQKTITTVKHTPEAIEADRELSDEIHEKSGTKKPAVRKSKEDDDDAGDDDEDRPVKKKIEVY